MRETGVYQVLGETRYFIPYPLPPSNPGFQFNEKIMTLYGEASFNLGLLDEMSTRLPDYKRFINAYIIKESLLSSEIEGIHTTILDVFTQPLLIGIKPNKQTQLVLNYTKALDAALHMIQIEKMPIVSRVILSAHIELMSLGVNDYADPGQYRKQSVRVGNLTPPSATKISELISDLEKYINTDNSLPPLIKSGIVHVQFQTIHPFLDGNGRIGRLLIVLSLINFGLLSVPILYPSFYFKKYQQEYYQRLDAVRTHGDFEGWIVYYLTAIKESSHDAHRRAKDIEQYEKILKQKIQTDDKFHKVRDVTLTTIDFLFQRPVTNAKELSEHLNKTYNTAQRILHHLEEVGLVIEKTTQKRNKHYCFQPYIALLEKDY